MRIRPNQVYLHEETRYEPDQDYDVADALGFYFCAVGWADNLDGDTTPEPQPDEVDLDVQNAALGVKGSNG